ncbi:MAG: xanthine dehydrogenase family protein subunit M [Anaerolineaceae bacterium]
MKPAAFDYYAPASVEEALETLDRLGYDGKVLAGGQSLIPAMNFRMARPTALVDLNKVKELFYITPTDDKGLLIGTMTRDSEVEHSKIVLERASSIVESMPHIAHPQVRNRGTFGGAMAHADPAGQLPGVALALDARMHIRGKNADRWVDADDFFTGPFMTVIEPQEMLSEVKIPGLLPHSGTTYRQTERQHGAQAQVAVSVYVSLDDDKKCCKANIVMLCVGERPMLIPNASKMLLGQEPTAALIAEVAKYIAAKEIDPSDDIHATADYRRHVTEVLLRQALTDAFITAGKKGG